MDEPNSPYVFREEAAARTADPVGAEVVIVDGRAMSYRWYRR
jgi:hypothetical protein